MMPQERLAAKSTELHGLVDSLLTLVSKAVAQQTPVHEVEREAFATLLRAGLATIQRLVECLGDGDVGATHQREDGRTLERSAQPQGRPYVSIFGPVAIQRFVYAIRAGQKIEFSEVDARLDLPEGKFSYLLQDWDQGFAMEQPFGKVSQTVERILGLRRHVDTLERMNRAWSETVTAFQAAQTPPPADEEGAIFVETGDGKGVPIRRPADAAPIQNHRPQPGPKPDRKKMATRGAVYSVDPFIRTPEEVVESLFRDPQQEEEETPPPAGPRPCHKRLRAILNHVDAEGDEIHGRAAVFGWMTHELAARNVGACKPIVCIMDGKQALWEAIAVFQADVPRTEVLDILHVTPRLWTAAD